MMLDEHKASGLSIKVTMPGLNQNRVFHNKKSKVDQIVEEERKGEVNFDKKKVEIKVDGNEAALNSIVASQISYLFEGGILLNQFPLVIKQNPYLISQLQNIFDGQVYFERKNKLVYRLYSSNQEITQQILQELNRLNDQIIQENKAKFESNKQKVGNK